MFKLKVTYYLTSEGLKYFPQWYAEVLEEAAQQQGFRGICYAKANDTIIVYLYFQNEPMLNLWRDKDSHEMLVEKIAKHFAQDPEVQEDDSAMLITK